MTVARGVTGTTTVPLGSWELAAAPPGGLADPVFLDPLDWLPARVPGGVAGAMPDGSEPDRAGMAGVTAAADEYDWWSRCRFPASAPAGAVAVLRCEGLAVVAEVWLN